jgi:hypothetical protein
LAVAWNVGSGLTVMAFPFRFTCRQSIPAAQRREGYEIQLQEPKYLAVWSPKNTCLPSVASLFNLELRYQGSRARHRRRGRHSAAAGTVLAAD